MLTSLDFLTVGREWSPAEERERLARYERNSRLWRGDHIDVMEGWDRLLTSDSYVHTVKLILNWHRRLTTLWCDLLLGKPPKILTATEYDVQRDRLENPQPTKEQQKLDSIVQRNYLEQVSYEVAIDVSRFGEGIYKMRTDPNGLVIIEAQPPDGWFPIVNPDNLREVTAHALTWKYYTERPRYWGFLGNREVEILRAEVHGRGGILNYAFELKGGKITAELDVEEVTDGERKFEEPTGVDDFLVVPVVNLRSSDALYGMDDYTDIESIIHEMEIRLSQTSRIMDRHADPSMAGPESILDVDPRTGRAKVEAGKFFPIGEGEEHPEYITWDGNLQASFTQVEKLLDMLYMLSETTPAAFGRLDSGLAQSGTALKRLLMSPVLKTQRLQGHFHPALTKVLGTAMELEGMPLQNQVRIEWRDGLPRDIVELSNVEAVRIQSGTTSVRSAIRRIDDATEVEIDQEMRDIEADKERQRENQLALAEETAKIAEEHTPTPPAPTQGKVTPDPVGTTGTKVYKDPDAKKENEG